MVRLTKDNFQNEVLGPKEPVVIGFVAEDNEECQDLLRVLEEIGKEHKGQVKVCVVQVNEEPTIALNYGVLDLPAAVVMDKGLFVRKLSKSMDKEQITQVLAGLL